MIRPSRGKVKRGQTKSTEGTRANNCAQASSAIDGTPVDLGGWILNVAERRPAKAGVEFPQEGIRVEIMGPNYALWTYGPKESPHVIKGLSGDFCRIAVPRMVPSECKLRTSADEAAQPLHVLLH